MKKISLIIAIIFIIVAVFSPMGFAQGAKGAKGGKKGKGGPVKDDPQYKEFVKEYDKNGDGEVSMEEYLGK